MRILIIGSRDTYDLDEEILSILRKEIVPYLNENPTIVSGGARGIDTLAEVIADEFNLEKDIFLADWDTHGKKAGILRNIEMINSNITVAFIFWDGVSKGTEHGLKEIQKLGISYHLFKFDKNGLSNKKGVSNVYKQVYKMANHYFC